MLSIRRGTDYAVRAVVFLAEIDDGTRVQVKDVARNLLLPLAFVRRIVTRLRHAGILETTRGITGGIRLARPAAEVSLLDVVHAMESGVALNRCVEAEHTCPMAEHCPAQRAWVSAAAVLERYLASVRLDALAGGTPRKAEAR